MSDDVPDKRPAYEPASGLLDPTGYHPEMKRPPTIVAGFVLVLLRLLAGAAVLFGVFLGWDAMVADPDLAEAGLALSRADSHLARLVVVGIGSVVLLLDAILVIFIFLGRNWARLIVMFVSLGSITSAFVAWWAQGQEITLRSTFVALSLDILVLLALSSRSASAYTRRNERR